MEVAVPGGHLAARVDGPEGAPWVVFCNALGTDMRVWDEVVRRLPFRCLRFDLRGHGRSAVPPPPYAMGRLVADAEAAMEAAGARDAIVVGLSIGGLVAQGLGAKRPDLCRGLVLACTAVRIGTAALWHERIAAIEAGGMAAVADGVLARWFASGFDPGPWRDRLLAVPPEGYVGCCHALATADMITPTSGLRMPVLALAGAEDRAVPPDMVREMAALVPGAAFEVLRGVGHIPPVEAPEAMAALIHDFAEAVGTG